MKKAKNGNGEGQVPNMVAQGTNIIGELNGDGDFRIDGTLNGNLITSGRIVVGDTGIVIGDLTCLQADISGKITGTLKVQELTLLKKLSHFEGNIFTNRLSIEPGAQFNGACKMTSSDKEK